ncbi:VOC family protein [Kribbella sp. NPDC058245]|uniref:VOC family protein n=1 Tax=Kribbella sp. NPDC058245 TaxID=3346399 RepID=UPI0036E23C28
MTIQRMDNVGIVVGDLDAAITFFTELGMEVEGTTQVEGPWADQCVGLDGVVCDVAMLRTPDGSGRFELAQYRHPVALPAPDNPPHNTLGMHRVMFTVDDIDDTVTRLRPYGAEVVGSVTQFGDSYRLCYIRGPEGILIGLAQELS